MKGVSQPRRWRETTDDRRRLFVIEAGSSALGAERASEFEETTAVAQAQGEQPLAFAARVLERVAAAERAGRRFRCAVMLLGYRGDIASTSARRSIARALMAHRGAAGGEFELSLEARPATTEHARDELLGLVEELTFGAPPAATPIRLHFGASSAVGRARSGGVFWNVAARRS